MLSFRTSKTNSYSPPLPNLSKHPVALTSVISIVNILELAISKVLTKDSESEGDFLSETGLLMGVEIGVEDRESIARNWEEGAEDG